MLTAGLSRITNRLSRLLRYLRKSAVRPSIRVHSCSYSRAFAVVLWALLDGVSPIDHEVFAVDHRGGVAREE